MLKTRMPEDRLLDDETAAMELHVSPERRLDRQLQNIFEAYAEEPVPPHLLALARRVEDALRRSGEAESGSSVTLSHPRRFYH